MIQQYDDMIQHILVQGLHYTDEVVGVSLWSRRVVIVVFIPH